MIDLSSDTISFSFTGVEAELRQRVAEWADAAVARFLEEDRAQAADTLLARWEYASADAGWKAAARATVQGLSREAIEGAVRARVASVAPRTQATISFQRTLRIPDDGKVHPLPPGLGQFPVRSIDALAEAGGHVPETMRARGGAVIPMYQAEAMWILFGYGYPCAIKIAAGGIDAITGERATRGLRKEPQNYVVSPGQPWLDGFCVAKGEIRQFVAMPLGEGYSAEEQLTGEAKFGGLQLQVTPLRPELYFASTLEPQLPRSLVDVLPGLVPPPPRPVAPMSPMAFGAPPPAPSAAAPGGAMGLGAGGRMKQEIFHDPRPLADYDRGASLGCFVHILNSTTWKGVTGQAPPQPPLSAQDYARYHFPWFDYYDDTKTAVDGGGILSKLKSVFAVAEERGQDSIFANDTPLPELPIVHLGPPERPGAIRGWRGEA